MQQLVCHSSFGEAQKARILFHMVNSVTCMNVGTSLEKAIKIVLTTIIGLFSGNGVMCV